MTFNVILILSVSLSSLLFGAGASFYWAGKYTHQLMNLPGTYKLEKFIQLIFGHVILSVFWFAFGVYTLMGAWVFAKLLLTL
jgi:hypothetical protein